MIPRREAAARESINRNGDLTAYVLEQRQRQRAARSAQKYLNLERGPPGDESDEDRVRGWISPLPDPLIAQRVWFHPVVSARFSAAAFISSVLRFLVGVRERATPYARGGTR